MTRFRHIIVLILALVGVWGVGRSTAHAAESKAELKVRFEKRFPQIAKLLDQGKIGETWEGYVEPIKSERDLADDARKLVKEENADRKKLYAMLAAETEKEVKKMSPEQVAERNAWRKFKEAEPGWLLKTREGVWLQRKDVDRLKRDGRIGEQWDGYLGAVTERDAADAHVKAVLAVENRIRGYTYERKADEARVDAAVEAERAGKQNIEKAGSGVYVRRSRNAEWERKK